MVRQPRIRPQIEQENIDKINKQTSVFTLYTKCIYIKYKVYLYRIQSVYALNTECIQAKYTFVIHDIFDK